MSEPFLKPRIAASTSMLFLLSRMNNLSKLLSANFKSWTAFDFANNLTFFEELSGSPQKDIVAEQAAHMMHVEWIYINPVT